MIDWQGQTKREQAALERRKRANQARRAAANCQAGHDYGRAPLRDVMARCKGCGYRRYDIERWEDAS